MVEVTFKSCLKNNIVEQEDDIDIKLFKLGIKESNMHHHLNEISMGENKLKKYLSIGYYNKLDKRK